jgi:uncharacterized protein YjbI with pentapeptide repeats
MDYDDLHNLAILHALLRVGKIISSNPEEMIYTFNGRRAALGRQCPRTLLANQDLTGLNLTAADLSNLDLVGTVVRRTILTSADISGSDIRGIVGLVEVVSCSGLAWEKIQATTEQVLWLARNVYQVDIS